MIFLPVLLSLAGPPPYLSAHKAVESGHKTRAVTAKRIGGTPSNKPVKEGIDGPFVTVVEPSGDVTLKRTEANCSANGEVHGNDNPAYNTEKL